MNNRFKHPIVWGVLLLVVVAVRLALTGDRDILALNAPYDEYWFVHSASRMVWGGHYNQLAFAQLPVYSLWLAFFHLFGFPARLAIDISWLLASGYLAYALYRLTDYKWVGVLSFLFLAFHPYSLVIFDRALAETLLVVLTTAVLAAGIELWNCRGVEVSWRRKLALSVFVVGFALAFHTRKEGIVLMVPLVLLAVWSWKKRGLWWSKEGKRQLAIPLLVAPLIATVALGIVLAGANYLRWGLFARYELAAPGYQNGMAALNSIDVGRTPRHVTVTAQTRALAYEASPTFRELKPFFEGAPGQQIATHSAQFTGVQGEIGNGWFYWSVRDAGAMAGWHVDARTADAKYSAIAEELHRAFETGRLKKRPFVISSHLDPDFGKWFGYVPTSVWSEISLLVWPKVASLGAPREDASPKQFEEFVAIVGRRNIRSPWSVSGWIVAPPGTMVGIGTAEKPASWLPLSDVQRPDVPGGYPFSVIVAAGGGVPHLHARTTGGRHGRVALSDLHQGQVAKLAGTLEGPLGIDELTGNEPVPRFERWFSYAMGRSVRMDWLSPLCALYGWIGYVFCFSAGASVIVAFTRKQSDSVLILVILLGAAAVLARAALLGVLDASSWSGLQARYIFPVVPVFTCLGMLGLAFTLGSFRQVQNMSHER